MKRCMWRDAPKSPDCKKPAVAICKGAPVCKRHAEIAAEMFGADTVRYIKPKSEPAPTGTDDLTMRPRTQEAP